MSSTYCPWWKRQMIKFLPFLFIKCVAGNYHWFYDRLCFCAEHLYHDESWHGGIFDLKRKVEYQRCPQCGECQTTKWFSFKKEPKQ